MRLVFAFSCKPTQRERFPDFNVFGALVGDPRAASHGRNEIDEDEEAPRRQCEIQRSQAGRERKKARLDHVLAQRAGGREEGKQTLEQDNQGGSRPTQAGNVCSAEDC